MEFSCFYCKKKVIIENSIVSFKPWGDLMVPVRYWTTKCLQLQVCLWQRINKCWQWEGRLRILCAHHRSFTKYHCRCPSPTEVIQLTNEQTNTGRFTKSRFLWHIETGKGQNPIRWKAKCQAEIRRTKVRTTTFYGGKMPTTFCLFVFFLVWWLHENWSLTLVVLSWRGNIFYLNLLHMSFIIEIKKIKKTEA